VLHILYRCTTHGILNKKIVCAFIVIVPKYTKKNWVGIWFFVFIKEILERIFVQQRFISKYFWVGGFSLKSQIPVDHIEISKGEIIGIWFHSINHLDHSPIWFKQFSVHSQKKGFIVMFSIGIPNFLTIIFLSPSIFHKKNFF